MELVSPRIKPDNHANTAQGGYSFQSNWAVSSCVEMSEVGVRKVDGYENNMVLDPSQGGDILLIDFLKIVGLSHFYPHITEGFFVEWIYFRWSCCFWFC
jgi:hypothetical protein